MSGKEVGGLEHRCKLGHRSIFCNPQRLDIKLLTLVWKNLSLSLVTIQEGTKLMEYDGMMLDCP